MPPCPKPVEIARLGLAVGEMVAPEVVVASERFVAESLEAMLKTPQKLGRVMGALEQPMAKGHPLADLQITRFLGSGESNFVLATEKNTALKIGPEGVLRPVANPQFEAPVLSHGDLTGGLKYFEQPLGVTKGVTEKHVKNVIGRMRAGGYVENDLWDFGRSRRDQVALFGSERKPLLIDQGSAIPGYGTRYDGGMLVPHPQQVSNISSITEFLGERRISLIPRSSIKPVNPLSAGDHMFSKGISDRRLTDSLSDYLSMTSAEPTAARYWTQGEIEHALSTIAQKSL